MKLNNKKKKKRSNYLMMEMIIIKMIFLQNQVQKNKQIFQNLHQLLNNFKKLIKINK